jgi:hypothetical protein
MRKEKSKEKVMIVKYIQEKERVQNNIAFIGSQQKSQFTQKI